MSKQNEKTFRVSGPNRVRGVEPGDTFKGNPDDAQIRRLLESGNIAPDTGAKGNANAKDAGDGDTKEKP